MSIKVRTNVFVEDARVRYTVDGVVHTGRVLLVDRDPLAYVWVTTDLNPDKSFTLPRCALEVLS